MLNSELAGLLGFSRGVIESGKNRIADKPHHLITYREICVHVAEVSTLENLHTAEIRPRWERKVRGW